MEQTPEHPCRRAVLAAGAAGVAAALTGCQVYGRPEPAPPPAGAGAQSPGAGSAEPDPSADPDSSQEPDQAGPVTAPVASTGDIAVGGGLILEDQNLVITQPTEGEFKGFSATCTHQGCTVTEVADGVIICQCHQSHFSIADGSVVQAAQGLTPDQQAPLPAAGIVVDGDAIGLA